jgi:type IV pilus assembly protein PilQ
MKIKLRTCSYAGFLGHKPLPTKVKYPLLSFVFLCLFFFAASYVVCAQEEPKKQTQTNNTQQPELNQAQPSSTQPQAPVQTPVVNETQAQPKGLEAENSKSVTTEQPVSQGPAATMQESAPKEAPPIEKTSVKEQEGIIPIMKFKDADIRIVLQAIAEKASRDGKKINIVVSPKVEGLVSVSLENIDWQSALEVVLKTYGFASMRYKDVIIVASLEEIKERETQDRERQGVEPPQMKIFKLKYIDAVDAKKAIIPLLSPVGKATVLELTGQAGWEFSTSTDAKSAAIKRERKKAEGVSRTKMLMVLDIARKLDEVDTLLKEIDKEPKQILIRARVMEVSRDLLRDLGIDWGTGAAGATYTVAGGRGFTDQLLSSKGDKNTYGGSSLWDIVTPSAFVPSTTGLTTANTGLKIAFKHLTGADLEVIFHALEEDARSNTLSAPSILTLNNQEASILVGQKYPIVETKVNDQTGRISGASLAYYQEIGVQLNVAPQIVGENEDAINIIIHPVVSSSNDVLEVKNEDGTTLVKYPIIDSRESDTQVLIRDGETIVMGGLLKDVKTKQELGIPFLSKLPLVGKAFRRDTFDTTKIDLVIFITAKIIKPGETVPEELVNTAGVKAPFRR